MLIQAYSDEHDKMAPACRRDAFCGKFSVMDVFCQYGARFTALQPHTVHPKSARFAANIDYFDRLCRVVKAMKGMVVGAIGARTTAFKRVRIDELALQKRGITMETLNLSDIFARMNVLSGSDDKVRAKSALLKQYTSWNGVPEAAFERISKLGVALDAVVEEYRMDAVAIGCWSEMQKQWEISPCVLLSEMNDRGVVAACEVDVGNAVTMYALSNASGKPATGLDWNNNYGDDHNKCILFHCGPLPQTLMTAKGRVTEHSIIGNSLGAGRGFGCNQGRIAPTPVTLGSLLTEAGKLKFYLGQGCITAEPIPEDFFGCAGVAEIEGVQNGLQTIGNSGHRDHVSVTPGHVADPCGRPSRSILDTR
jgi:L-fucose isomerase-like protein